MDIHQATHSYEQWLAKFTPLVLADLAFKHRQMSAGVFPFLRATFYRWTQLWPATCPELAAAPRLLAVGDLHVENFGTWRDTEGRLIWGINDFDEAFVFPYTIDLVRLATTVVMLTPTAHHKISAATACATILDGYASALSTGGNPFVLAEKHLVLRDLATNRLRDPVQFWAKMANLKQRAALPTSVAPTVKKMLPPGISYRVVRRTAGLGSLGKPRFVALAQWNGGMMAREAKALVPSAALWSSGKAHGSPRYQDILTRAVRCPDPLLAVRGRWIVRRLAPYCSRIELDSLATVSDVEKLLHAMGRETANIHLGTPTAIKAIKADLRKRKGNWLLSAAKAMAQATEKDWQAWRRS